MEKSTRLGELRVGDGSSRWLRACAMHRFGSRYKSGVCLGSRERLMSTFYRLKITATEKPDAILA